MEVFYGHAAANWPQEENLPQFLVVSVIITTFTNAAEVA